MNSLTYYLAPIEAIYLVATLQYEIADKWRFTRAISSKIHYYEAFS